MSLTEGLLITIIIILTLIVIINGRSTLPPWVRVWDCVDRKTGEITSVQISNHGKMCKCPKCSVPEQNSLQENVEYFTDCPENESRKDLANLCDDAKFEYTVGEFGRDFKDWVINKAIDEQVIKNHTEFVKERMGRNTQNILGRTYSPDSHDSYDPIPWIGLRRPQAVKVCNPTQVADVDYNLYSKKPTFTWSSS